MWHPPAHAIIEMTRLCCGWMVSSRIRSSAARASAFEAIGVRSMASFTPEGRIAVQLFLSAVWAGPPPRQISRKREGRRLHTAAFLPCAGKLEFPTLIRGTLTNSDSGDDSSRDDCNSGDGGDNGSSGRGSDKGSSGGGNNMPKQESARLRRTAMLALRHSQSTIAAWNFPFCRPTLTV